MKLHANARTCPNSRALIVERVLEEGWSLAAAAEAAGVSERDGAKWVRRFRGEGRAGFVDRSSAPRRSPTRTPAERGRGDRGVAALADDGGRDRRDPRDGALDRVALAQADRARQALAARRRRSRRTATSAAARASSCTSTSRSSAAFRRGAGHRVARPRHEPVQRAATGRGRGHRLGVRARLRRRPLPARLCRGACDERGATRGRLPRPRGRLVRRARGQGRARDDRQRLLLPLARHAPRCRELGLRHLRIRPYRPAHQRQGRALHPDPLNDGPTPASTAAQHERTAALALLAQPLQLPATTRLPRPPAARSSARRTATNNLTSNYRLRQQDIAASPRHASRAQPTHRPFLPWRDSFRKVDAHVSRTRGQSQTCVYAISLDLKFPQFAGF